MTVSAYVFVECNEIGKYVVEKIQSTGGVLRTSTNIVAD